MIARTMLSSCVVAVLVGAVLPAAAPVCARQVLPLKEGQVTEDALIDALTPAPILQPALQPASQPTRTRSIRVMRDDESGGAGGGPSGGPGVVAPKPASASLLITFETNSAVLTARAQRLLDVVGDALASDKLGSFRFGIEGYADPRGTSAVNLKLSQARAESVRNYLVASKRIDPARLEPVGKGDQQLLNKTNPSAAENRRVTIVNLSR